MIQTIRTFFCVFFFLCGCCHRETHASNLSDDGYVMLAGNGGSAATAEMMCEMLKKTVKSFQNKKDLKIQSICHNLLDVNEEYQNSIRDNLGSLDKNDVLIVFSTSGSSQNVIQGLQEGKKRKAFTSAVVGMNGGKVLQDVDRPWGAGLIWHIAGPQKEYVQVYNDMVVNGLAECREVVKISSRDSSFAPSQIERTTLFPLLTTLTYRGGNGRSYSEGFESAEVFLAYHRPDSRSYPFIDLKAHRVGEGKFAGNYGLGWRVFSVTHEEMFGANVFYDYRKIQNGGLHQLGLGMELLGKYWDIRGNGYIPLANQRAFIDKVEYSYSNPSYSATTEEFERGMWGFDMEIGQYLCRKKPFEIYNAIGPYFYGSHYNTNSMVGGMGRIFVRYKQYLTMQFFITHDRNLHTLAQGEIFITFPSPRSKRFRDCFYKRVERNNIILTEFIFSDWITNF